MSMTKTQINYIGRCQCGYAFRVADGEAQPVERYRDMETPAVPYRMGAQHYVRCPQRHKPFKLYRIEGEYSDKFKCDARCENAKGHDCKCSCAGMNHGKTWDAPAEIHGLSPLPAVTTVKPEESHGILSEVSPGPEPLFSAAIAKGNERFGVAGLEVGGVSVSNDELRGISEDHELEAAERRLIDEQMRQVREPDQHIGEVGEKVYFDGECIAAQPINDTILYKFVTKDPARVEWWKPDFLDDPGYELGKTYKLKAKVKRHDDNPRWGKSTVVTYLEEI